MSTGLKRLTPGQEALFGKLKQDYEQYSKLFKVTRKKHMHCEECGHTFNFRDNFDLTRHISSKRHYNGGMLARLEAIYEAATVDNTPWKIDVIFKEVTSVSHGLHTLL